MFFFKRRNDEMNELRLQLDDERIAVNYWHDLSVKWHKKFEAKQKEISHYKAEIDRQADLIAVYQAKQPKRGARGRWVAK